MTQTSAPIRPPASAARPAAPRVEAPSSQEGEHRPPPEPVAREAQGGEATATEGPKPAARTFGPGELSAIAAAGNPDDVEAALEALASGNDGSRQQGMAEGREDEAQSALLRNQNRVERIRQEVKISAIDVNIPEEVLSNSKFKEMYFESLEENAKTGRQDLRNRSIQALTAFHNTPEGLAVLQNNPEFVKKKQEIAAQFQTDGRTASDEEINKEAVKIYLKEKYGEVSKERKDPHKNEEQRQDADRRAQRAVYDSLVIKQLDQSMNNPTLSEEQLRRFMEHREKLALALYEKEYYKGLDEKDPWIALLSFIVSTIIIETKTFVVDNAMPDQRR